jgi:glyoxylase-like metal-dependent hydrolase (beta-lactamase superfamily II)
MSNPAFIDLPGRICCIDTRYQRPGLAACYLIESAGEAAFIDTGTAHSLPLLMRMLKEKGLQPNQVKYVIPTHVHLDHAGGAGGLMQRLPDATLVIHPFGARHMIDPAKLIAGATAVYGEARFKQLYGRLTPVEADRVLQASDGLTLTLGNRRLLCLETPGHARHHICIHDEQTNGWFSGDTFGLSYREFDTRNGPFILPTSTPVQFDPEAWHTSLERLMTSRPSAIYLTHFGRLATPERLVDQLHQGIDDFVAIAERADPADRFKQIRYGLFDWVVKRLARHACPHSPEQIEALLGMDLDLNAQGLGVWLDRKQ